MRRKKTTKVGDIFAVKMDEHHQRFFQYIVNDTAQLSSCVIRVFKKSYPLEASIDWNEVVHGEVDFYAHTILCVGIHYNLWELVANVPEFGVYSHVWFKSSRDYGKPQVEISERWSIWQIGQERIYVGKLLPFYSSIELGTVVSAWDVIERMKTGKYSFKYPGF